MLRAADAHGNAKFAAARRVFNVNDPNHDPEERFVDLCDSLAHPESYLPGETPTPEHTAGIDSPQEPLTRQQAQEDTTDVQTRRLANVDPPRQPVAQQRTQVDAINLQTQQRTAATTRSHTRRNNSQRESAEAVAEDSDEDAS